VFTVTFEETGSELIASKETEEIKLTGPLQQDVKKKSHGLSILRKILADAKLEA
jgi:hypothetical protein